jgi:hypothetical protein
VLRNGFEVAGVQKAYSNLTFNPRSQGLGLALVGHSVWVVFEYWRKAPAGSQDACPGFSSTSTDLFSA